MEDIEEEFDIVEFFNTKGQPLEPFRREYTELQKNLDLLTTGSIGKEREIDMLTSELKMLREQVAFTRRNVDELISQQEVMKETIDHITHKKEALHDNEQSNRSEINIYSGVFAELKESLSVGADWSAEQLESRLNLEKERDFISSKLENKANQLIALRHDIERSYEFFEGIEKDVQSLDKNIETLDTKKFELKRESIKLLQQKELVEKNIFETRGMYKDKENELHEKFLFNQQEEKSTKLLEDGIRKSKQQMEVYIKEYEKLFHKIQDSNKELENLKQSNIKCQEEMEERLTQNELVEIEIKKLKKEYNEKQLLCKAAQEKCSEIEKLKTDAEIKCEELIKKNQDLQENEFKIVRREIENLEKQISTVKQELDILRKKHLGSERTSKAMADLIILNRNGKVNLGVEIRILNEEIEHHKHAIRQLTTEKEKYEHDTEVANQQYYTALEELKLQEMQVHELNKKIVQDQMKLKQKQSLYESVRSDRNLFSKQLLDAQDEINLLKRKFRSMNHQIDQLKEDISSKDHAIVKEHFLHHSVDKEREILKNEIAKIKKQVLASEGIIENQRAEIMKLQRIIDEAEQERQRQRNELTTVLSERNLLTGQLVKRNEELNNMYEKIKINRNDLKVGERNYLKYYDEIRVLQEEIRSLVELNNETVVGLTNFDGIKHDIVLLEKDIIKEKTKSRALLDELEVPMNVHRWRILESSDPKKFDKITQIHGLQKQLVEMSDQITSHELLIQEKEKIYVELKNVIARHPGPEIEEQILLYQQTFKDKNKQLQSLDQELEMYIEQVHRFKEDIADSDIQMAKINKQWIKTKKQNSALYNE